MSLVVRQVDLMPDAAAMRELFGPNLTTEVHTWSYPDPGSNELAFQVDARPPQGVTSWDDTSQNIASIHVATYGTAAETHPHLVLVDRLTSAQHDLGLHVVRREFIRPGTPHQRLSRSVMSFVLSRAPD